jgi:dTDP-4-dehydrorhamnose reductase
MDTVLIPVSSDNLKTDANRPNFSVLSSDKIKNKYKFAFPSWMEALKDNFELVN